VATLSAATTSTEILRLVNEQSYSCGRFTVQMCTSVILQAQPSSGRLGQFHNLPSESQPVCVQWLLLAQRSRSADDAVNPDQTPMTGRIDCFGRIPLSSYIAPEYITISGKQLVNPKNAIIPHSRKKREFVAYLMKRWGDSERSIMTIKGVSVSWPNRDLHRIPNDFDALRLDNRRGERAASCRRSLLRRSRC
jgi:hypothetical protein